VRFHRVLPPAPSQPTTWPPHAARHNALPPMNPRKSAASARSRSLWMPILPRCEASRPCFSGTRKT
jgi:hypothetical protein